MIHVLLVTNFPENLIKISKYAENIPEMTKNVNDILYNSIKFSLIHKVYGLYPLDPKQDNN